MLKEHLNAKSSLRLLGGVTFQFPQTPDPYRLRLTQSGPYDYPDTNEQFTQTIRVLAHFRQLTNWRQVQSFDSLRWC